MVHSSFARCLIHCRHDPIRSTWNMRHYQQVHVFYCVLALMVARLMVREADHAGMHLSVRELLDTLAGIEETLMLYQGERGRPRARRMLTEIDPTQRRLYGLFGLDAYAPKR